MKNIKEKPTECVPKSKAAREIPKAALKKAWAEAKEKSRTKLWESTSSQENGDCNAAQNTGVKLADTSYSAIKQNTDFTVRQGQKFACKKIEKYRKHCNAEQVEMQTSARTEGQKKKLSPPRPRRAIFVA